MLLRCEGKKKARTMTYFFTGDAELFLVLFSGDVGLVTVKVFPGDFDSIVHSVFCKNAKKAGGDVEPCY
jgi:hypothetical protein